MELLIGISVLVIVFLLGAVISAGNERQRRAIDGIREQAEAWAEQDIRIKRETLARQIVVTDPLAWLEKTAAAALGSAPKLVSATPWQKEGMGAIVAQCQNGGCLVFTPVPRQRLLKALSDRSRRALDGIQTSLLGPSPAKAPYQELSLVTGGMFFDIEAAQVWQIVTGETLPVSHLTLYEVPEAGSKVRRIF